MKGLENIILRCAIIIFFIGILVANIFSQEKEQFKFGLAVAPSINWLNVKTDGVTSQGATLNLNYGLITDFAIKGSDKYFISSGIKMLSNGGKLNYTGVVEQNDLFYQASHEVNTTMRYVEIPLGLKLRSNEVGYSIFAGWFGFGTGFRVNAFQERNTTWTDGTSSYSEHIKKESIEDMINPVRFSMMIGFEWERKITKDTYFTFGFTLNNGLSNVFKGNTYQLDESRNLDFSSVNADGSPNGDRLKATNKTVSLHAGIYF